jgi:hypothetical protein
VGTDPVLAEYLRPLAQQHRWTAVWPDPTSPWPRWPPYRAAGGPTFVFSAALDGSVRLWKTSTEPMPVPVEQRPYLATALAAADTPAGPVLAVAWSDAELHLWHVPSGRMRALPLLHACHALALTSRGVLVIGGPDGLYAVRLRPDTLWEP